MKKLLIGAVLILVAIIVVGPKALSSHARATKELTGEQIAKMIPDAHEATRIRIMLRDLDGQIADYRDQITDVAKKASDAEKKINDATAEVERQKKILQRAKTLLESGDGPYDINGKTYSAADVQVDAKARIAKIRSLESQIEAYTAMAQKLRAAEQEGRENLGQVRKARVEKAGELDELEVRLRNARMLAQINDLTRGLRESPLGPDTELGKTLASFRDRVRDAERLAGEIGGFDEATVVDWEGTRERTESVLTTIDQMLREEAENLQTSSE